jgi:hypothetical protein
VAVNGIYASIIPSYKYNLVLKSFSYGTQVMGHPYIKAAKSFFNVPSEKLSPRPLADVEGFRGQGVHNTFCATKNL